MAPVTVDDVREVSIGFDPDPARSMSLRSEAYTDPKWAAARPLREQAADLAVEIERWAPDVAELTHARRLTYDVKTNWKNVIGNFMVFQILPAGPDRTLETWDFYFETEELSEAEVQAVRYIDEALQQQDISLVESVQRGMKTPAFDQGRIVYDPAGSGLSEHGVHHFHGLVLDAYRSLVHVEEEVVERRVSLSALSPSGA